MAHILSVAWAAYRAERKGPKRPRFAGDGRDFLPAALEIVETPPSPTARWTALLLVALIAGAFAWSWFGHVDVVAVADGRIVPSGRVKVIQPLETGVVRAIHVEDGARVRQGDVLVELDPTSVAAEHERLARELAAAQVTAVRLRAILTAQSRGDLERLYVPPADAAPVLIETQRRLMIGEWAEYEDHMRMLRDDVERRRGERAGIEAATAGYRRSVPIQRERFAMRAQLAQSGAGSRLNQLDEEQRLVAEERELAVQRQRLVETTAAIAHAESQVRQYDSDFRRSHLVDLNEAEQKAAITSQDLIRAEMRRRLQTLESPINGTVQQLAIHTVGGVVVPAQQLMVIVPDEDALEIEATLQNRDIGFVHAGQEVEIKLETFLFTRYGTVRGHVVSVSSDAIVDPSQPHTLPQGQGQGQPQAQGQPPQGPIYIARVRLERTAMEIDGRTVPLGPGMRATVEIKTDQRRVLDYLISPVLRYRHESFREQ